MDFQPPPRNRPHRTGWFIAVAVLLAAFGAWGEGTVSFQAPQPEIPAHPPTAVAAPLESAAHSPKSLSGTNDSGISPVLRASASTITNSNLVYSAHDGEKVDPAKEFKIILDLARQQRANKMFTLARRSLYSLLNTRAADDIKQTAVLELATMAEEENDLGKAQQFYGQFLRRWPDDLNVSEVYLRQGLLYRKMGASSLALAKFYSVMTSSISVKSGNLDYYQRLVLHAQTEIADTHFLLGQYTEAADFFSRLLKQDAPQLNKELTVYKLLRCLSALGQHEEAIALARDFLDRYPASAEQAEVRFFLASSLKQSGKKAEALKHVLLLLETQQALAQEDRAKWGYWQRRAGNEIANQLYEERDYVHALTVYGALAAIDSTPSWQLPIWYQMGLAYERLNQPQKAAETYQRILAGQKGLDSNASPSLKTVLDMAKWRMEFLTWQAVTERGGQTNAPTTAALPLPTEP
jgi:tetratricopeptide (TPR) repeat protein